MAPAKESHEPTSPCPHLAEYKARSRPQSFQWLPSILDAGPWGRARIKCGPSDVPQCSGCKKSTGRLYTCLLCGSIGCWSSASVGHAKKHALATQGHELSIDVDRAELFCCICDDQVYDKDFDEAVLYAQLSVSFRSNGVKRPGDNEPACEAKAPAKRFKTVAYEPWVPTAEQQKALSAGATELREDPALPLGLRGLNNLGNTCFMNSVLQALLHTPPLRNYFLSDRHNRLQCQRRASHLCLGCDMDDMFAAAFCGSRTPFSPAQFLYSWWRHAEDLAGYEQQDAHEFFISAVDGIHANSGSTSPRARNRSGDAECRCIVHRVFSGILRSDVMCTVCGFTSTTFDPCVDISLDLEPQATEKNGSSAGHDHSATPPKPTGLPGGNGQAGGSGNGEDAGVPSASIPTLRGCLDRFTRPERLGTNEKFYCQFCATRQESIKQMSVRKLPLVLCFHIKRFEHSTRRSTRKLDRLVKFPLSLDMMPYLSSSIVRLRHGNRLSVRDLNGLGQADHAPGSDPSQDSASLYDLFAVVTHAGKLDSGHYVSYIRLRGSWYKCDDAWVTKVDEKVVKAAQGYMLYYVRRSLSYRANGAEWGSQANPADSPGMDDAAREAFVTATLSSSQATRS